MARRLIPAARDKPGAMAEKGNFTGIGRGRGRSRGRGFSFATQAPVEVTGGGGRRSREDKQARVLVEPKWTLSTPSTQFIKRHIINHGAYGTVHVALYGDAICAAKILHKALYQYKRGAHSHPVEQFKKECDILRKIIHPCVVQYLGEAVDPDSGLPVLFMELMDTNLTEFLERSGSPPPYHLQVNICHDIVSALSYLHSINYIHGDVSSNNILLSLDSYRAKLSDFGMSKLSSEAIDVEAGLGSIVYLAPECTSFQTVCTNKIDIFSVGVIGLQIATCEFPEPSPIYNISEVDRRQNHIQIIPDSHHLKSIFIACLHNVPDERLSAHQLCERFLAQKNTSTYKDSIQSSKSHEVESLQTKCDTLTLTIQELTGYNEKLQMELQRKNEEAETFLAEIDSQRKMTSSLRSELESFRREKRSQGASIFRRMGLFNTETEQKLRQAEQEKREALEECERTKKEANSYKKKIEANLASCRSQFEGALGKYDDMEQEFSRTSRLLEQQTVQLKDACKELSAEREKTETLEIQAGEREEKIQSLTLILRKAKQQLTLDDDVYDNDLQQDQELLSTHEDLLPPLYDSFPLSRQRSFRDLHIPQPTSHRGPNTYRSRTAPVYIGRNLYTKPVSQRSVDSPLRSMVPPPMHMSNRHRLHTAPQLAQYTELSQRSVDSPLSSMVPPMHMSNRHRLHTAPQLAQYTEDEAFPLPDQHDQQNYQEYLLDHDEYLAVLMQQCNIISRDQPWEAIFAVCRNEPSLVESLKNLLETFGELKVASFSIKFEDTAVILNIPEDEIKRQGYSITTDVHPCKIKKTEVRQSMESRATAIYPPRCTLTITPLPKCEKTLMVTLTLEGVETCSNQRQFCLTSPRLLASPQQVFNPQTPQLDPKSEGIEAHTNDVAKLLGTELTQSQKTFQFGQALGVEYRVLTELNRKSQFQQGHISPSYQFFCETVEYWRKQHDSTPSWENIVLALRTIKEPKLVSVVVKHLRNGS
ncbi:uncharacterized protein LOC135341577 isoform X3 [Halichondria panicea]|uniref:uncharacterized protein LOC135341577 isoform X3 n=1 Tax=Halichondria panicea TaxID=6063 RepID=UPI00312BAB73